MRHIKYTSQATKYFYCKVKINQSGKGIGENSNTNRTRINKPKKQKDKQGNICVKYWVFSWVLGFFSFFFFFSFSFPLLPCNTAARPNQFGMPGIVPPYVPSQMLNIPQTSLQAKPVVSTASALLLGRGLLCSANWNPGGKGVASFFSLDSHWLNFKSGTKVMLQAGGTVFVLKMDEF